MFTPNSEIRLLSVPLTMGDGKQLDFNNITAQTNYFKGKTQFTYTDYNYQRQDRAITVSIPGGVDALMACNYIMYQNKNFTNKWFYAFITRKEWVSENAARLYLKTDAFQTWLFDFKLMPSMVEREHTPTDRDYEHTLPENVPVGDYIELTRREITGFSMDASSGTNFDKNMRVIFAMSDTVEGVEPAPGDLPAGGDFATYLGGMPAGIRYYGVDRDYIRMMWDAINNAGRADAVIAVYAVPKNACNWVALWPGLSYITVHAYTPIEKDFPNVKITPARNGIIESVGTYKNKKVMCYPYHYYRLINYAGQTIDIKAENFAQVTNNDMRFSISFNPQVNAEIMVCPVHYCTITNTSQGRNPEYGATYSSFAEIPTRTNLYENYIALNKSKIGVSIGKLAMSAITGFALQGASVAAGVSTAMQTGKPSALRGISGTDMIYDSANGAVELAAQMQDLHRQPEKTNGAANGNALQQNNCAGVYLSEVCTKKEYLDIIDQYFTMYGYKVMTLKTPQFKSRPLFNYLKTVDVDISGNIPQEDLQELRAMFDNGITVWHSGDNFGNYTGDNSPR